MARGAALAERADRLSRSARMLMPTSVDVARLRALFPDLSIGTCVGCGGEAVMFPEHEPYHVLCDPRAVWS